MAALLTKHLRRIDPGLDQGTAGADLLDRFLPERIEIDGAIAVCRRRRFAFRLSSESRLMWSTSSSAPSTSLPNSQFEKPPLGSRESVGGPRIFLEEARESSREIRQRGSIPLAQVVQSLWRRLPQRLPCPFCQ